MVLVAGGRGGQDAALLLSNVDLFLRKGDLLKSQWRHVDFKFSFLY